MRYAFYTTDVFTDRIFGGNPLAVFPEAQGLNPAQMQRIAGELNLSETAFVTPAEDPAHSRQVRIFTPKIELPFAGHPTIGAAFVLAATGQIALGGEQTQLVFEEQVGPVRVDVQSRTGGRSRPVYGRRRCRYSAHRRRGVRSLPDCFQWRQRRWQKGR